MGVEHNRDATGEPVPGFFVPGLDLDDYDVSQLAEGLLMLSQALALRDCCQPPAERAALGLPAG